MQYCIVLFMLHKAGKEIYYMLYTACHASGSTCVSQVAVLALCGWHPVLQGAVSPLTTQHLPLRLCCIAACAALKEQCKWACCTPYCNALK